MKRALEVAGKLLLLWILVVISMFSAGLLLPAVSGMYAQELLLVAIPSLMYALFERKRNWPMGIRQKDAVRRFLFGAGWGIILISAVFLGVLALGGVRVAEIHVSGFPQTPVLEILLLFFLVAVAEEWLVRGYAQGLVAHHFRKTTAWTVSAAWFALLHGFNPGVWEHPLSMINLVLAGLFLAAYRDITRGIWAPAGFHFTWNVFQGPVFGFHVSGIGFDSVLTLEAPGPAWISGGDFGAEGSLACTAVLFLGMVFMLRKPGESQG
jgi:membrane protease YdiL (CAAX protease family)